MEENYQEPARQEIPPPRYYPKKYQPQAWRFYPAIDAMRLIIHMIGLIIIFIGVIGVGFWINSFGDDVESEEKRSFEYSMRRLSNQVIIIGVGGIRLSVSYLIGAVAQFLKGGYEILETRK